MDDRSSDRRERRADLAWLAAIVSGVALLAAAIFIYLPTTTPPAPVPKAPPRAPVSRADTAPAPRAPIEHPVDALRAAETPPVATLADSDGAIAEALGHLLGSESVRKWLHADAMVRRFVATVDNVPRHTLALKIRSLRPLPGRFEVARNGDTITLADANAARYAPLVLAFERVDAKQLAGVYLRFYPLFQQAYGELGYPQAYFNDRLVVAIDHVLATPEPGAPLRLKQPKVLYEFEDPQLEALSAGQKALLRMGPDNARRVKAKLRALRAEITAAPKS